MKTYGKKVDDMIIKNPVAIKAAFGENPKTVYHAKNQMPITRMGCVSLIRDALKKTMEYKVKLKAKEADFDIKLESLLGVLEKKYPLKCHVHRTDDIFTAIRIAKEFDIDITLEHCTEGHLITEYLKEENLPIMVGPSLCDRSKPELKNLTFETPGILANAGLCVAIITDHPVVPIQYLSLCGALAVKNGMKQKDALLAITKNPAKNTGIDKRVGSLKKGKDADIVVFDKHPLELMSIAILVFIDGKRVK